MEGGSKENEKEQEIVPLQLFLSTWLVMGIFLVYIILGPVICYLSEGMGHQAMSS